MDVTFLGHAAFRVVFGDKVILIDPFLTGNPRFAGTVEDAIAGCTHVVLTHGHDDHVGDTPQIAKELGAQVVANYEICMWLQDHGVTDINPTNHGGRVDCGGFTVAFVPAWHSSGTRRDGQSIYLGNPAGIVIEAPGEKTLYHMGDTDIFSDMGLVNELYQPKIGIVPIGDRFTMGARTAALACRRYFDFDHIVPCHYATFPILDETPDAFLSELGDMKPRAAVMEPGDKRSF